MIKGQSSNNSWCGNFPVIGNDLRSAGGALNGQPDQRALGRGSVGATEAGEGVGVPGQEGEGTAGDDGQTGAGADLRQVRYQWVSGCHKEGGY